MLPILHNSNTRNIWTSSLPKAPTETSDNTFRRKILLFCPPRKGLVGQKSKIFRLQVLSSVSASRKKHYISQIMHHISWTRKSDPPPHHFNQCTYVASGRYGDPQSSAYAWNQCTYVASGRCRVPQSSFHVVKLHFPLSVACILHGEKISHRFRCWNLFC